MSKKVIQFIHGLTSGGAETMVKDYAIELKKRGYDVRVLVLYSYPEMPNEIAVRDSGIPVIEIRGKGKAYSSAIINKIHNIISAFRTRRRVLRYLKQEKPDIIHVHLFLLHYLVGANFLRNGTRIIYTCHNTAEKIFLENNCECKLNFWSARWFLHYCSTRIIALHTNMAKEINNIFNISNTIVLNNPVDLQRFWNAGVTKREYRKKIGIPENAYVIGHVGRFSEQKNHEFLVQVFRKVVSFIPNAFLLLVGDGELKFQTEKMLDNDLTKGRYLILSNRGDIPQLMQTMDIFCFPSRFEGLGIAVLEAQAARLNCLVSENVPSDTMVTMGIQQLSIEDLNLWVNKIKEIKNSNTNNQRDIANRLSDFDLPKIIDKLEMIYFG